MVIGVRNSSKYIPELALVAEKDGEIIGYIILSKTSIKSADKEFPALNLGPVCTLLEERNRKIGGELIKTVLAKAKEMGHTAVFLAGNKDYYSRFGFVPASKFGIKCQHNVPDELLDNIMVLELIPNALKGITGTVYL